MAHDEECVIGSTVEGVMNALSTEDKLFVVADNCADATVNIAKQAGASVVIRNNGSAIGKGDALAWFLRNYRQDILDYSLVVVLDADSEIKSDFIVPLKTNKINERNVYQCFVYPRFNQEAPIGKLAALSELLDQHVNDKIRKTLKWPVRLRGTGMIFPPEILIEVSNEVHTHVEDIALSLLLTARGIQINRIDEVIVFDPKPASSVEAAQQRARWFRGQFQAIWRYRKEILRILVMGPAGWSLLSSLFLRPKWLVLISSFLLALFLSHWQLVSLFFWAYFILGVFFLSLSLILIPERRSFIRPLFHIPAYIWMWLHSIIFSIFPSSWHRVRK